MALSLDDPARTGWLGFSPAVVIAASVVVIAAGGFSAMGGRSHGFRADVADMCEQSVKQQAAFHAYLLTPQHRPSEQSIPFGVARQARQHLQVLTALRPAAEDLAERDELIAAERQILAEAETVQAWVGPSLDRGDLNASHGRSDEILSPWRKAVVLNDRYERDFGVTHCSD